MSGIGWRTFIAHSIIDSCLLIDIYVFIHFLGLGEDPWRRCFTEEVVAPLHLDENDKDTIKIQAIIHEVLDNADEGFM